MSAASPQARRHVAWKILQEHLADAVICQLDRVDIPEWEEMRRRRMRVCWNDWREACDEMRETNDERNAA